MLAMLQAQANRMDARRIVFEALDIMLALLPDAAAAAFVVKPFTRESLTRKLQTVLSR